LAVKLNGKALVHGLAVTAVSCLGCSSSPTDEPTSLASTESQKQDKVGQIALQLTLPGGQSLGSVSYAVANPANTVTGTYTFPAGTESSAFVISGIPLGTGYQASLSCLSADGTVSCTGTDVPANDATPGFDVRTGTLPTVNVLLTCTVNTDAGTP
jgi:hypothetical protein